MVPVSSQPNLYTSLKKDKWARKPDHNKHRVVDNKFKVYHSTRTKLFLCEKEKASKDKNFLFCGVTSGRNVHMVALHVLSSDGLIVQLAIYLVMHDYSMNSNCCAVRSHGRL